MRRIVLDTNCLLMCISSRVSPTFFFNLIQIDPDDNKFVDCAICGNAEYIVSNDTHFNILKNIEFPKIKVVKIDEFLTECQ